MGGLLRIKKVDLFAKGLRSFATFTEAAVPGTASRCDSGKGVSCRGSLRTSATFSKSQTAGRSGGPRCLDCSGSGKQKKPTTLSVVGSAQGEAI